MSYDVRLEINIIEYHIIRNDPDNLIEIKYNCIYNCIVIFEWDDNKRIINIEKHGIDFNAAKQLWDSKMITKIDNRKNYNEIRLIGLGQANHRVMIVVFKIISNEVIRIISLRKANKRESHYYEKETR